MNKFDNICVVGLTGAAGCGKDTLAQKLVEKGWVRVAFADALKDMCIDYLGLSHDDVYTQEGKMRFNETWGMTNREILQKVGTDAMRDGFHNDVWIKIAEIKIRKLLSENKKVIVTDCRFDNEAQMCESLGGICVRIVRPNIQSNLTGVEKTHSSESGISDGFISFEISNNSTVEAMFSWFCEMLKNFENKYNTVANELETYSIKNKQYRKQIEDFLLNYKKCFNVDGGKLVLDSEDNDSFAIELDNYNGYEILLKAQLSESKIYYRLCKRNAASAIREGSFLFGDGKSWKAFVNDLLLIVISKLE